MNYTNTDLEPMYELNGVPVMPCVKSGFCCERRPCSYGEINQERTHCIHLAPPNELGQRDCLKYDWIVANVPGYEFHPAFGAGCSSTLFNHTRQAVIEKIKELKDIQTAQK